MSPVILKTYRVSGALGVMYWPAESKKKARQGYTRLWLEVIGDPVNRHNVRRRSRGLRVELLAG